MKTFREFLNEAELFKAEFTDPFKNEKVLSSNGRIVNASGNLESLANLSDIVDDIEVTKETGNSGYKHYREYLMKRVKEAASKSKDNESFAKELNKIFKVNIFKAY